MIERKLNSHNVAPSITSMSGAGMAGAGAYSSHGHGSDEAHQQQYDEEYAQQQYAATHQPIQARQQYTYGQSYDQGYDQQQGSDHGHEAEYNGAYSSDPQQQGIYAAEAYAYPGEADQVVVSPGMHAQDMGHQQYQQQYEQSHDAYGGM